MPGQSRGQEFLAELVRLPQDLPYSPALLRDLFTMAGEKSLASLEAVGEAVSRDQGLTTRVLVLANSAFYGLQAQVTSVPRAMALLGIKEIRTLVLLVGVQSMVGARPLPPGFDYQAYWRHQLYTATCATKLCEIAAIPSPDILFTAGLLHDLGKLLAALLRPGDWSAIREASLSSGRPDHETEQEYWGLDHGLVGAMAMGSWNLPPSLSEPISWHHAPTLCAEFPREAKILCMADALTHELDADGYPHGCPLQDWLEEFGMEYETILSEMEAVLQDESLEEFLRLFHS